MRLHGATSSWARDHDLVTQQVLVAALGHPGRPLHLPRLRCVCDRPVDCSTVGCRQNPTRVAGRATSSFSGDPRPRQVDADQTIAADEPSPLAALAGAR